MEFVGTATTNQSLNLYQNFTIPAGTTMTYSAITVQNGATQTIGGGGRVAIYSSSAKSFTGFSTSTASGGSTTSTDTTTFGSNGTIAFFDTSVANNNVSIYQNYTLAASSTTTFHSLTLAGGATLNVGGSAQLLSTGTVDIAGTVYAQSVNNTAQVSGVYAGRGIKITAGMLTVEKTGIITVDGEAYPATTGPGAGVGGGSRGGSYGGLGGGESTGTYGSATAPASTCRPTARCWPTARWRSLSTSRQSTIRR